MTRQQDICIEMRMLLTCIRHQLGASAPEDIAALLESNAEGMDWNKLIDLARNHHCVPYLHRALKAASARTARRPVPGAILRRLTRLYLDNAAVNLRMTHRLNAITDLLGTVPRRFERNGACVIPIKGPVLAMQAYGSISYRQFRDLDLVVPGNHLLQVVETLVRSGYRIKRPPARTDKRAYLAAGQDWILTDDRQDVVLDIKPSVISRAIAGPAITADLARHTTAASILDGRTMNIPSPESMLIVVCMHGAHETWAKLSQVSDAAGIARRPDMDWRRVMETAKQWRQKRALLIGLGLCRNLMGIRIPDETEAALERDPAAMRLAAESADELLSPGHEYRTPSRIKWRLERRSRDTLFSRIRCALYQLATPSEIDLAVVSLPGRVYFLYCFVRLFRLARGFTRRVDKPDKSGRPRQAPRIASRHRGAARPSQKAGR